MKYSIIIGVILLVVATVIGVEISKKYTKKRIFFNDFNSFNQILLSEMSFMKCTIPEIVKNHSRTQSVFYTGLLSKYLYKKEIVLDAPFLNENEKKFYFEYVDNIGKIHYKAGIDYVSSVKQKIDAYLSNAIIDEEKKKPLCIKVAFMIGLICMIACL